MGLQDVNRDDGNVALQAFKKHLLGDLRALEQMLDQGCIESGIRRVGVEQEVFIVDSAWHPAPISMELLERIDDPRFTTELARFNLEMNLDPQEFGGDCLRVMETQLLELIAKARSAAQTMNSDVVLTGILPTLQQSDLDLGNITDRPRYHALNDALTQLRGSAYEFKISGVDELSFKHYSVMLEACNTSFQVHFQTGPEEFSKLYNVAQAISAPVLAASVNSPLLFGKRLWRETRIALFQQSVDTRNTSTHLREISPRVSFGSHWVDDGVLEIFQEDIARFKVLLSTEIDENPFELLEQGQVPRLKALLLHNSTVYRWNRPCYGISNGKPHLRIECRFLPSGPTPLDEVANAAFWFGLMASISNDYPDVRSAMDFDDAKSNFLAASRMGLDAHFNWFDGKRYTAQELICQELVPRAREGLTQANIDRDDVNRYLNVIEDRVRLHKTGASWLVDSLAEMKGQGSKSERMAALVAATITRQAEGKPAHEWEPARIDEAGGWAHNFARVEQYMTTDLFTVNEDEIVDLVANIMDWKKVRHIPVEDSEHRLVGLVSYRSLLRFLARGEHKEKVEPAPVRDLMERDIVSIPPETPTLQAIELMRERRISCLPVVKDERLVGIITESDFTDVARQLLEGFLRDLHQPK